MADKQTTTDVPEAIDDRSTMLEMLRKMLLASVGVAAVAQEEIETFVNRLVERGEIAETDARHLVNDVRDRSAQHVDDLREEQERRLDAALKRVNLPTRTEVTALSDRLSALLDQVDDMLDAASD